MYYARRAGLDALEQQSFVNQSGGEGAVPGPRGGATVFSRGGAGGGAVVGSSRPDVFVTQTVYSSPFASVPPVVVAAKRRVTNAEQAVNQAEQEYRHAQKFGTIPDAVALALARAIQDYNREASRADDEAAQDVAGDEIAQGATGKGSGKQDEEEVGQPVEKKAAEKGDGGVPGLFDKQQAGPVPDADPRRVVSDADRQNARAAAKAAYDAVVREAQGKADAAAQGLKNRLIEQANKRFGENSPRAAAAIDQIEQQYQVALPQIYTNASQSAGNAASTAAQNAYTKSFSLRGLSGLGAGTQASTGGQGGTIQYGGANIPGTVATGLVTPVPFQGKAGPQGQRDIQASIRNIALTKYGRFDGSMVSDPGGSGQACSGSMVFYQGVCTTPEIARLLQVTEGAPGLPSSIVMGQEVGRGAGYSDIMQKYAERAIMRESGAGGAQTGGGYPVMQQSGGADVSFAQSGGGSPAQQYAETVPGGPVEPHEDWFREAPGSAAEAESIETMGGMGRFYYR